MNNLITDGWSLNAVSWPRKTAYDAQNYRKNKMGKVVTSFRDLTLWQKSHELTLEVYKLTKDFPSEEKYGVTSQIRRSSYSVPSNVIEGHSRKSKKEFLQFLSIAKGSLEELKYFIILSKDLEYLSPEAANKLESMSEEVSKLLYVFTKSVENSER